jgi:hypothetical protein
MEDTLFSTMNDPFRRCHLIEAGFRIYLLVQPCVRRNVKDLP